MKIYLLLLHVDITTIDILKYILRSFSYRLYTFIYKWDCSIYLSISWTFLYAKKNIIASFFYDCKIFHYMVLM